MIHTNAAAVLVVFLGLPSIGWGQGDKKSGASTQNPDIKKLIEDLRAREKALRGVQLRMKTVGSYPSGLTFETRGTLRVLGTTHFHITVNSSFKDTAQDSVMASLLEKVITPDGVWTHQKGPAEEVYTRTDAALMKRLREAERTLSAERGAAMRNPGPMAGQGEAPLGSAMLASLDLQFELKLQPDPVQLNGVSCRLIKGNWRGFRGLGLPTGEPIYPRGVVRVEVFVRAADGIPIKMVQYNRAKLVGQEYQEAEALLLEIEDLVLDPGFKPESFKLAVPEGTVFKPVTEHPPSRAQINRIMDEYESLLEERKKKANGNGKTRKPGKGEDNKGR